MVKHSTILLILAIAAVSAMFAGCEQKNMLYSDAEYIMFSDTAAVYPVMKGEDYFFKVPVTSKRLVPGASPVVVTNTPVAPLANCR